MKRTAAAVLCLLVVAAAHAEFIACPVREARTEIVTAIPSPWWQTPQIWPLQGTAIETIGGQHTLVCKYPAYDGTARIMRLPPKGEKCKAVAKGFDCR